MDQQQSQEVETLAKELLYQDHGKAYMEYAAAIEKYQAQVRQRKEEQESEKLYEYLEQAQAKIVAQGLALPSREETIQLLQEEMALARLTEELRQKTTPKDGLEQTILDLLTQLKKNQDELEKTKAQLEIADSKFSKIKNNLEETVWNLKRQLNQAWENQDEIQSKLEDAEIKLSVRASEVEGLKNNIQCLVLRDQKSPRDNFEAETVSNFQMLKSELEKVHKKLDGLNDQMSKGQEQEELQKMKVLNEKLGSENARLQVELSESTTEIKLLKKYNAEFERIYDEKDGKIQELEKELSDVVDKFEKRDLEFEDMKKKYKEVVVRLNSFDEVPKVVEDLELEDSQLQFQLQQQQEQQEKQLQPQQQLQQQLQQQQQQQKLQQQQLPPGEIEDHQTPTDSDSSHSKEVEECLSLHKKYLDACFNNGPDVPLTCYHEYKRCYNGLSKEDKKTCAGIGEQIFKELKNKDQSLSKQKKAEQKELQKQEELEKLREINKTLKSETALLQKVSDFADELEKKGNEYEDMKKKYKEEVVKSMEAFELKDSQLQQQQQQQLPPRETKDHQTPTDFDSSHSKEVEECLDFQQRYLSAYFNKESDLLLKCYKEYKRCYNGLSEEDQETCMKIGEKIYEKLENKNKSLSKQEKAEQEELQKQEELEKLREINKKLKSETVLLQKVSDFADELEKTGSEYEDMKKKYRELNETDEVRKAMEALELRDSQLQLQQREQQQKQQVDKMTMDHQKYEEEDVVMNSVDRLRKTMAAFELQRSQLQQQRQQQQQQQKEEKQLQQQQLQQQQLQQLQPQQAQQQEQQQQQQQQLDKKTKDQTEDSSYSRELKECVSLQKKCLDAFYNADNELYFKFGNEYSRCYAVLSKEDQQKCMAERTKYYKDRNEKNMNSQ